MSNISKIRLLSAKTINLIAAGEVVERPASVVKELMENSIDAGATEIEVTISTAGKNLISVKDNGSGMSKDDMQIAIQRYATSKLDEDDIFKIHTFGFRGEALPSIASISRMTIYSRTKNSEFGNKMVMEGGEIKSIHTSPCKIGTLIEVRDLFYAVPARLKFLKNDRAETTYITEIFNKIALAHPNITFRLLNDIKTLIFYEKTDSQEDRIRQVLGDEFWNHGLRINSEINGVNIRGMVSQPTYNKRTSAEQYFYVNNRPIKDKYLYLAMRIAYQDVMAPDRYPAGVLFIDMPYHEIDVNVHPAKTEIRFRDIEAVRSAVSQSIKSHLEQNSLHSTSVTSKSFYDHILKSPQPTLYAQNENKAHNNNALYDHDVVFVKPNPILFEPVKKPIETQTLERPKAIEQPHIQQNISMSINYPLGHAKCQIFGTYMLSESDDKVFIIDIHAAHERIIYERFKRDIKQGVRRQKLLFAEEIKMQEAKVASIMEHSDVFEKFGFVIDKEHSNHILVKEVPALVRIKNLAALFEDIAEDIHSYDFTSRIDELFEHFYETLACHTSIRAGDNLSIPEMNQLLRDMEQTLLIDQCNHGRPTYSTISKKDFEKLFHRG